MSEFPFLKPGMDIFMSVRDAMIRIFFIYVLSMYRGSNNHYSFLVLADQI